MSVIFEHRTKNLSTAWLQVKLSNEIGSFRFKKFSPLYYFFQVKNENAHANN